MLKKIFLMSLFCSFATANQSSEYKPIASLEPNIQLYFEQEVSIEVDDFVKKVAKAIGFTPEVAVAQPSEYAKETYPAYNYIVAIKAPGLLLSIDKTWFDSLTEGEKFYGITFQLMNQVPSHEYTEWKSKFDKQKLIFNSTSAILQLGAFATTYYNLKSSLPLKLGRYEWSIYTDKWYKKAFIAMCVAVGCELALYPIEILINKFEASKIQEISFNKLKTWVLKYDCLDYAISYTNKLIYTSEKKIRRFRLVQSW